MSLNPSPLGIAADSGRVWSFAGREFDESRLELKVGGEPVELELKPLEVLIQLLKHAGEVVPKDQLLNAVWPGLNVVDGSLATAIHKLRKALGDHDSEIVVTVPRVGYRLAPVAHRTTARLPPAPAEMSLQVGHSIPGRDPALICCAARSVTTTSSHTLLGQVQNQTNRFGQSSPARRLRLQMGSPLVGQTIKFGVTPGIRFLPVGFDETPIF